MIDDIKTILELDLADTGGNSLIQTLIRLETSMINGYISQTTLPQELEFLVIEGVVERYNRRGAEGMVSESIEKHAKSFEPKENRLKVIKPFLDSWMKKQESKRTGFRTFRW